MIFAKNSSKAISATKFKQKKKKIMAFSLNVLLLKGLQKPYENNIASGYFSSLTGNMIHLAK